MKRLPFLIVLSVSAGLLWWAYSYMGAVAAEPESEAQRAELIQIIQTANVSQEVKDRVVAILKDDRSPFDEKEVLGHFESADGGDAQSIAWRQGMLHAWCFRNRSSPEALASLYDKLPKQYRPLYGMLVMTQNAAYISPGYAAVADKVLSDAVESADAASTDEAQRAGISHASTAAQFLLSTQYPSALGSLEQVIREKVVNHDLRFNLLAVALTRGTEAEGLARWYWQTYCFQPYEITALMQYFRRHLDESAMQALVEYKELVFKRAQVQLQSPRASQPATTAPTQ